MSGVQSNLFGRPEGYHGLVQNSGAIMRGEGPPHPNRGHVGNVYIDTTTWFLYVRRFCDGAPTWGNWVFQVPTTIRYSVQWYCSGFPSDALGRPGDYAFVWDCGTFSLVPHVFGPKTDTWPEAGDGPAFDIDTSGFYAIGHLGEDTTLQAFPSQFIQAIGMLGEQGDVGDYIAPLNSGQMIGLGSMGRDMMATLNPGAMSCEDDGNASLMVRTFIQRAGMTYDATNPNQLAEAVSMVFGPPNQPF